MQIKKFQVFRFKPNFGEINIVGPKKFMFLGFKGNFAKKHWDPKTFKLEKKSQVQNILEPKKFGSKKSSSPKILCVYHRDRV